MEAHVKAINSLVSPAEAACELGLQPKVKDNACIVSCPNCDKPMFVLDTGFVCSSHNCNFKAGGVIDIISLTENVSISKSCEYFFEAFASKAKKISKYKDLEFLSDLTMRLRYKRKLLEFFLRRRNSEPDRAYAIQAMGALGKAGIRLQDNRLTGFVLSTEEAAELNVILGHYETGLPSLPPATAMLVIPYFSDHHTIDSLTVSTPARPSRDHKTIELERNSRLVWAGLLQAHPATKKVELVESAMDMLIANTTHARTGTGKEIALHCRYKSTIADVVWKPETCRYVISEESEATPVIALSRLDSCLSEMTLSVKGVERNVRDYVLETCTSALIKDGFTASTKLLLEAAQINEQERFTLLAKLHDARAYDTAEGVRKFLRVVLVHKDEKSLLYATPDGYLTARDESADKVPVTNFVLDVTSNIVFPDSQDVFHAADLTIDGHRRSIVLKPTDIDRIVDLEAAVRFASGNLDSEEILENKLPTVRDKNCGRIMSSYLRHKISEAPRIEGIPFLGWNDQRTRFYGPYWYADKKAGCIQYDAVMHPFKVDMQYFANAPFAARSLHLDLPSGAATVIAQYASMLVRSYLHYPVGAIHYYDDDKHVQAFSSLFDALGQRYMITASPNKRNTSGVVEDAGRIFKGLPYLVRSFSEGLNTRTVDFIRSAAFCLGAQGCVLNDIENFKPRENDIKSCTAHVVFAVLEWILKTEAKTFEPAKSVSFAQCAAIEGSAIIEQACGVTTWNRKNSEYTSLEAFLADVRYEEVNQYVHYNINEHIVTLDLASRKDLSVNAIAAEIAKLGAEKVTVEGNKITTDSASMMEALESYYHSRPTVSESFDPEALFSDT